MYWDLFAVYLFFALTNAAAAAVFVGGRSYKRDRCFAARVAVACAALVAACFALAGLGTVILAYVQDGLAYSLLGVMQLAALCFLTDMKKSKCFYVTVAGFLSRHAGSRLAMCAVRYMHVQNVFARTAVSSALILATIALLWYAFGRAVQKDERYSPDIKQTVALFVVGCVAMYMSYLEPVLLASGDLNGVVYSVFEAIFCYSLLGFQFVMYRQAKRTLAISYESELNAMRVRQYEDMRTVIDAMNIKYHDLKHQIRDIASGGKVDEGVLRSIEKTLADYSTFVDTGNPELDALLTEKNAVCVADGITLSCKIDGAALGFLSPEEMRSYFGNALDNAIEYLRTVERENRFVHIVTEKSGFFVKLTVENYFDGELKLGKNGLPVSSKGDALYHGYGTKSMAEIAKAHGGATAFSAGGGTFKAETVFAADESRIR